ncbi:hypothetical protein [Hyalangium sp.]|uniref:hypothetical protein n=1 Tax=Hyalangium sp. TaxID=2028555 RepID=UPI002D632024|nr:hypothetical protein [Hyalangium sp.]HYH96246.1 hypothetical protein [Hyalangium sp.]
MSVDSLSRSSSPAVKSPEPVAAPASAPAPAPAPAAPVAPKNEKSTFEAAPRSQPVNLTGQSAPATQGAQAAQSAFRYIPGTTGLAATGSSQSALKTTEAAMGPPGTSHTQTFESTEGVGVGFKVETTTSPVVTKPEQDGPESKVKLQVKSSVYGYVGDEVGGKHLTLEGRLIQGISSTHEIELPLEDYNRWVSEGSDPNKLPNPYDPTSIPPGATVTLKDEHFGSSELSVAYRNIQAQTGNTHSRGTSMAIERQEPADPPTVKVTTGPTEAVQRTLGVGVGTDDFGVSLTGERTLESYNLQSATFDLSTDQGKAAYNQFLLTGKLPEQSGPGVADIQREYKMSYSEAVKAGLVVGDHEFSLNLSNVEQEIKVTETATERTIEMGYFSTGDEGLSTVRSQSYYRDDNGEWVPSPGGSTQVAYSNLSAQDTARLQEIFTGTPGDPRAGGSYNAQFTLSDDQALMLAQRARKYSKDNFGLGNGEADVFIRELSEARTPEEVQRAFNGARGNTASVEALLVLYGHAWEPMPLGSGYQQAKR